MLKGVNCFYIQFKIGVWNVKRCKRKTRKNKDIKVTPKIIKFIKEYVKKYPTTTLWEFSKIVNKEFKIRLTDKTIHNILHRNKITRKRLRSRYYPEKREGQEKMDLETFYNRLKKYDYKKQFV